MNGRLRNVAVVLAGGTGTRVGLSIPKQLIKIAGKPIIEHTIAAMQQSPLVDEILVHKVLRWHQIHYGPEVWKYDAVAGLCIVVSLLTKAPSQETQELVEHVRYPDLKLGTT